MAQLDEYNRKRDFDKTSEPSGKREKSSKLPIFVIQKHAASHLHYDFRLEADGKLLSWAVPKGPSLDPADKRLAVHVEDHPLSYANFEGHIPEGQYGAGDVIVWDTGFFLPEGIELDGNKINHANVDKVISQAMKKGKLTFSLKGKKLEGSWSLVRMHGRGEKNWLLVKSDDEYADADVDITEKINSAISRKRLKDPDGAEPKLKAASARSKGRKPTVKTASKKTVTKSALKKDAAKAVKKKPAAKPLIEVRARLEGDVKPMLATLADKAFDSDDYIFEPKLDGIRVVAYLDGADVRLMSRNGLDITAKFKDIVAELSSLDLHCVLDGELVAIDEQGVPSFELLQARSIIMSKNAPDKIKNRKLDLRYAIFDLLALDGASYLEDSLPTRKNVLLKTLKISRKPHLEIVQPFKGSGKEAYARAVQMGYEGIVAKAANGTYHAGKRSPEWLKVKAVKSGEFIICGYTSGTGGRATDFGALVLAERQKDGRLVYAGKVGTGFNRQNMADLKLRFRGLASKKSSIDTDLRADEVHWLEPKLVAEIKFHEMTRQGLLRQPVFLRVREDIAADSLNPDDQKAVKSTAAVAQSKKTPKSSVPTDEVVKSGSNAGICVINGHSVKLSHLDKVLWPGDKKSKAVTKGDYLHYLTEVSPYILPFAKDRPLTMIRMPEGVGGPKFFQRHGDIKGTPDFVETVEYFSDGTGEDGHYMICDNLETLIWTGQMGALELHAAHTRAATGGTRATLEGTGSLEKVEDSVFNYPDFVVLDLDPYLYSGREKRGEEPELHREGFKQTVQAAYWLKETLMSIGLNGFIKTSGKTGLHIYIPIERNLKYRVVRECAEVIGKHLLSNHPKEITMDWAVKKRTGRIFFDHNMNGRGKTLPLPYSVRASLQATVSTPLSWRELESVYPTDFTVYTVPERLREVGDLWADILDERRDLKKILNL